MYRHRVISPVRFDWDAAKNAWTREHRGFDFAVASRVFESWCLAVEDTRHDYGEQRVITLGEVDARCYVVVYTMREPDLCRIVSARKANARETRKYRNARPSE